ncbi:MAG: hypothetical protein JXR64_01505 [Spirochaetales bacterium]|nr:hypothetical protein [Spirochaetales bacterium]
MKITEAKLIIKEIYKTESVTALISERGVGKTSAFKQCAQELGIGYIDLYAAALEGPDFMGLPDRDRSKNSTVYLPPTFLPTEDAVKNGYFSPSGILVLEEINRVSAETTSVLYPLLLDRKLNGHTLAPGWKLGITMNPDNLNYIVNTLDDAMIDRFITVEIEPDIKSYIDYSLTNNPNRTVLNYLETYPDMLLVVNNQSTPLLKSPTPRGWTKVQELLNSCNIPQNLIQEVISGIVGPVAAASFIGYFEKNHYKNPSSTDILYNYQTVKDQLIKILDSKDTDRISTIISSLVSTINGEEKTEHLNSFLNDLPQEFQIMFFKEINLSKPEIIQKISGDLDCYNTVIDKIIDLLVS